MIKILKVAEWRDEAKTSGGMRDLKAFYGPSSVSIVAACIVSGWFYKREHEKDSGLNPLRY